MCLSDGQTIDERIKQREKEEINPGVPNSKTFNENTLNQEILKIEKQFSNNENYHEEEEKKAATARSSPEFK